MSYITFDYNLRNRDEETPGWNKDDVPVCRH
jgi:hypothetical protein